MFRHTIMHGMTTSKVQTSFGWSFVIILVYLSFLGKKIYLYVSAVQNVNEALSVTRVRGKRCFDVLFVWGQRAGPSRGQHCLVSWDWGEDIYSREKIKRRTENTGVREGGEEFTGSSTVENTGEVTAGLLRMKQVSVPSIHCQWEGCLCLQFTSSRWPASGVRCPSAQPARSLSTLWSRCSRKNKMKYDHSVQFIQV